MAKTKNVFISHRGTDDEHVQSLKKRLIDSGYTIRNFSVDSTKHTDKSRPSDPTIFRKLKELIRGCGTFICLIGKETYNSDYVNYEIRQAYLQGKRIIGIYKHGCKNNVDLPDAFKKYGGPLLGWNSLDKLGDALDGKNLPNENPDSTISSPIHKFPSIKCNR